MTERYRGGETKILSEEFLERQKYANADIFTKIKSLDTHKEGYNYGTLNDSFEPVVLVVESSGENLANFPELAETVQVLPFVAQAFSELRQDYRDFILRRGEYDTRIPRRLLKGDTEADILSFPRHIEDLIPTRGYINFNQEYSRYMNFMLASYEEALLDIDKYNISNFDEMMKNFFKEFETSSVLYPVTKSGFALSKRCTVMSTGLCIELADFDFDIDRVKGEIITSPGFQCYADFCNSYGFFVDKNVPWRIIADIDSEEMQKYIIKGRDLPLSSAKPLYNDMFLLKTHYDDLPDLWDFLSLLFKSLSRKLQIANHSIENNIKYKIETLLRIRYMELNMPNHKIQEEIEKCIDFINIYGLYYTLGYIGKLTSSYVKESYNK